MIGSNLRFTSIASEGYTGKSKQTIRNFEAFANLTREESGKISPVRVHALQRTALSEPLMGGVNNEEKEREETKGSHRRRVRIMLALVAIAVALQLQTSRAPSLECLGKRRPWWISRARSLHCTEIKAHRAVSLVVQNDRNVDFSPPMSHWLSGFRIASHRSANRPRNRMCVSWCHRTQAGME